MGSPLQVWISLYVLMDLRGGKRILKLWRLHVAIKTHHPLFPLTAAAQFLGAGNLWENRGDRFGLGAEPQVHQHLLYEDTGHVDRDTC